MASGRVQGRAKNPPTKESIDYADQARSSRTRAPERDPTGRQDQFSVLLASVILAIVVGYSGDDSLDTRSIWTLVTILAPAYMQPGHRQGELVRAPLGHRRKHAVGGEDPLAVHQ